MIEVETAEAFASEVLTASEALPVLVDFWAPWCGPCKTLGPILQRFADATPGVRVVKVNVDVVPEISNTYMVRSIPTMLFFVKGKPRDQLVGLQPNMEKVLESKLSSVQTAYTPNPA